MTRDLASRLRSQGWRGLLPILPPDARPARWLEGAKLEEFLRGRGKAPGRYLGDGLWANLGAWTAHPDDEATVEAWSAWPGVGIGLRGCHDEQNVVLIDADILHPATAGDARRIIRGRIGLNAPVRIGREPKEAFPVRTSAPVPKTKTAEVLIDSQKCAVELIGAGAQAVLAGIHPLTRQPYRWPMGGPDEIAPEDLPLVPLCDLLDLFRELEGMLLARGDRIGRTGKRSSQGHGTGTARLAEELRARKPLLALAAALAVRNTDWAYDDWVAWAYALRGAFGDAGEALWLAFTRQSAKCTRAATAEKVWRDVTKAEAEGKLRSGAGAVVETALAEGWAPPAELPTDLPDLPGAPERAVAVLRAYLAEAAAQEAARRAEDAAILAAMSAGAGKADGAAAPDGGPDELDADEAATRLDAALEEQIKRAYAWNAAAGPAPQHAIQAAAGLGKTTRAFAKIAENTTRVAVDDLDFNRTEVPETHVFAPESKLLAEHAVIAKGHKLPAQVIRGRAAELDGGPPCRKHKEATAVARAGLPVLPVLCREGSPAAPGTTCEFYDECDFLEQFRFGDPAVRLFPHSYLPLMDSLAKMPPSFGTPDPAMTVIDESFWQSLTRHVSFLLEQLMAPRRGVKPEAESEIRETAAKVVALIVQGQDPREAGNAVTFRRLAGLELSASPDLGITPAMKWKVQKERAAVLKASPAFLFAAFWRALADECGKARPLQRVVPHRADGEPARVIVHERRELAVSGPVLALDASLGERVVRKFLPRLETTRIPARRNMTLTQVSDTVCSRRKLLGYQGGSEAHNATAANRLRDVRRFAEVVAARTRRRHGPNARVLLVAYLEVERRLLAEGAIEGVDIAHFGALRGVDRYKDHAAVIIAGRQQPAMHGHFDKDGVYHPGAEDIARAIFGDDDEPLTPATRGKRLPEERRFHHMRDGSRRYVDVEVHPDPRVQEIIELLRERESEQALDRLRLVHRETPVEVYVLSNLPLAVPVERLVKWRDLVPSRLEVAAARLDGVLPLAPVRLAERFPDLWEKPKEAEHDIARAAFSNPQTPIETSLWEFGGLKPAQYRLRGRAGGKPGRALIRADHPAPETALADLVGPLAAFRWEGEAAPEPGAEAERGAEPEPVPLAPEEGEESSRRRSRATSRTLSAGVRRSTPSGSPATGRRRPGPPRPARPLPPADGAGAWSPPAGSSASRAGGSPARASISPRSAGGRSPGPSSRSPREADRDRAGLPRPDPSRSTGERPAAAREVRLCVVRTIVPAAASGDSPGPSWPRA